MGRARQEDKIQPVPGEVYPIGITLLILRIQIFHHLIPRICKTLAHHLLCRPILLITVWKLQRAQKALEDSSQGECIPEIENALKDELKFQQESNATISLQLKRSQEANVELVSVLQELEETIEQQKIEIGNLSSLTSKFSDLEKSLQQSIKENKHLMQQLEQMEESKKTLLVKVQELERALEDKIGDAEHAKIQNTKTLTDIEMEYEIKLSAKDEEIFSLKAELSESLPERCDAETLGRR
ncbi:hypothetical protein RJT34_03474 [Clitoria ternatea]|uniref:Uncharacterized protein n=1 Tax=Clitoria ternatea TaxID=43366 RepID=A0AAN9Q1S7_CLITE